MPGLRIPIRKQRCSVPFRRVSKHRRPNYPPSSGGGVSGSCYPSRANPGCSRGDAPPGVAPPRSVSGVLLGHFLSAETDDALVSAERGETHPDRYGGALFLTRQAGVWKPLWYSSGTITDHCMKVRSASGRDVPVCESAYIMGGHRTHDLYALTILPTGPVEQILLSTDTFAWPNRLQKETLDSVKPLSRDGSTMVEVRVHYFRSDNPGGSDLSDPDKIAGEPHIIDFHLEGTKFVVTPASAGS